MKYKYDRMVEQNGGKADVTFDELLKEAEAYAANNNGKGFKNIHTNNGQVNKNNEKKGKKKPWWHSDRLDSFNAEHGDPPR